MRIAVVIPALDEADEIEAAVASARSGDAARRDPQDPLIDVLVVDGGSRDRTPDRARAAGARVIGSSPGRARQLETGWRASEGEAVLFLHADTRLPSGWARAVRDALLAPDVVGGAFQLRFRERAAGLRLIEWGARARSRWAGLPYGDQALFARRSALEAIGGVAPVAIGEDLDLVRALRRRGRLVRVPLAVSTSARRYAAHGVFRTWLRHALALAGWRLGADRERLARWVRR